MRGWPTPLYQRIPVSWPWHIYYIVLGLFERRALGLRVSLTSLVSHQIPQEKTPLGIQPIFRHSFIFSSVAYWLIFIKKEAQQKKRTWKIKKQYLQTEKKSKINGEQQGKPKREKMGNSSLVHLPICTLFAFMLLSRCFFCFYFAWCCLLFSRLRKTNK